MKDLSYLFLLLFLVFVLACQKEDDKVLTSEPEIKISESAIILEEEEAAGISLIDSSTVKVEAPLLKDSLQIGDVLVSGANDRFPEGFLGKVVQIDQVGNDLEIKTEPASLTDIIEECSIRFNVELSPDDTMRTNTFNLDADLVVYDADDDLSTKDDQLTLGGELTTDLDFDFNLDIENFSVTYFYVGFSSNDNATLDLSYNLSGAVFDMEKVLRPTYNFAPINIQVGVLPITIFPAFVVRMGSKGQLSGAISFSIERTAYFNAGVFYENGTWDNTSTNVTTYEPIEPDINGSASLEAFFRPGIEFYLYNHKEFRSSIFLKPYIKGEVSCNSNEFQCDYEILKGLELASEIEVEILDRTLLDYSNTFIDESEIIYEGSTDPDYGTFTDDRDGQTYDWTKIGDQIWMAENLNYQTGSSLCYEDLLANCDTYGALYNQSDLTQACPDGWKVPEIEDYLSLFSYLGGMEVADFKLRSDNFGGTNETGFNVKAAPYAQYVVVGGPYYSYHLSNSHSPLLTASVNPDNGRPIIVNFTPSGIQLMNYNNTGLFSQDEKMPCRCIKE